MWWALVVAFCAMTGYGWSAGFIIADEVHWHPPHWPSPSPPPHRPPHPPRPPRVYSFAALELRTLNVQCRIEGQRAVTTLEQEFYNPNATQIEGTYLFPVPKGAQLDKFNMEIGGKSVAAELMAAEKARGIYEDIVRKLKDPALLEYAGQDVFKTRIFPIEPRGSRRLKISYSQMLKADAGLLEYLLPLGAEKFSSRPLDSLSVRVEIEAGPALKSIYSPSHPVEIKRHGSNRATVSYESRSGGSAESGDFHLYFSREQGDLGLELLTHREPGEDGFFMLLAAPGIEGGGKILPKDVVFVVDTSGSMAGRKLEQARKALTFCITSLGQEDRFEILRFSTEAEPLFDRLERASEQNRSRAEAFVKDFKALGGTAIDDALRKGLSLRPDKSERPFVLIFLTDGRPTIGITDEDQILAGVRQRGGGTRVFCFGIGTDVNTHLLDKVTEATRASSQYVLPEEDLEVKVSTFFSRINEPVLANPELKFSGGVRGSRYYPDPLPDLFKGEQLILVGRYSDSGDSAITIEGSVNGAKKRFAHEGKFPVEEQGNEFIARLWATRRVGHLLDEIRLHGENSELRDEVTGLARQYNLVTPYTAYLIVEDEERRNVPAQSRVLQSLGKDKDVREEASRNWSRFKTDSTGEAAVAGARYGLALRSAIAPAAAADNTQIEAKRALGLPTGPTAVPAEQTSSRSRLLDYSAQTRFAGGKSFFQNGQEWIDGGVQQHPEASRIEVRFGSEKYFELARNSRFAPWLALGKNVRFFWDNKVYVITE